MQVLYHRLFVNSLLVNFFHPKVMPPFSIHQTYHPPQVLLIHQVQEQTPP